MQSFSSGVKKLRLRIRMISVLFANKHFVHLDKRRPEDGEHTATVIIMHGLGDTVIRLRFLPSRVA